MPIIAQVKSDHVSRKLDGRCIVKFELLVNKDFDSCLVPGTVVIAPKRRRRGVRPYDIIGVCYEVTRTTPTSFLARTRPIITRGATEVEDEMWAAPYAALIKAGETLFTFSSIFVKWSRVEIKIGDCQYLQVVETRPTRRPEAAKMLGMRDFDDTIMDLPDFEWPEVWTSRMTITNIFAGNAFAMDEADQTVDREFALKVDAECTICHEVCRDAFVTCGYCMNQLHATCLADYKATAGDAGKMCPTCRNEVF